MAERVYEIWVCPDPECDNYRTDEHGEWGRRCDSSVHSGDVESAPDLKRIEVVERVAPKPPYDVRGGGSITFKQTEGMRVW